MMNRQVLIELAEEAFHHFVREYTDGELLDMLSGNSGAYGGMPDLSNWVEPHALVPDCCVVDPTHAHRRDE